MGSKASLATGWPLPRPTVGRGRPTLGAASGSLWSCCLTAARRRSAPKLCGWALSTQVKDLRRHGKKLDEAHLERLVALLVLLLKDDNGQAGPPHLRPHLHLHPRLHPDPAPEPEPGPDPDPGHLPLSLALTLWP